MKRVREPRFEKMPAADLRTYQFQQFKLAVDHAWSESEFYRDLWRASAFDPQLLASIEDVARVPIVRKQDMLRDAAENPPFGKRLSVPREEIVQVVESSGTSSLGKEVQALTASDLELILRTKEYQFAWSGVSAGTVTGLYLPITMAAGGTWSLAALQRLGANVLRLGAMSTEQRLECMMRYGVEVTGASTAYLTRMERAAEEAGIDLQRDFPRLRSIYVSGSWAVEWAEERARKWNVQLFEVYGCSQRGFAFSCEWGALRGRERGVLHFLPHLGFTEVIDPNTGEPVADGDEGEVVITPFAQFGTPVIRYGTGDRARFVAHGHCACGREWNGIAAGSVGRYDDMLRIKDVNVSPETVESVVFGLSIVVDYAGEISVAPDGREVARVAIQFESNTPEADRAAAIAAIGDRLFQSIRIHFNVVEWDGPSLLDESNSGYRRESGKIQRWSDRRTPTQPDAR